MCDAEQAWLRLLMRGDVQLLVHIGTGEMVELPNIAGDDAWVLQFGSSGVGVLKRGAEARLAGEALAERIQLRECGNGNVALNIVRRCDGRETWHAVRRSSYNSKAVQVDCEAGQFLGALPLQRLSSWWSCALVPSVAAQVHVPQGWR